MSRTLDVVGSPPHVRGKVFVTYPATYLYGITPAYAGKSLHPSAVQANAWDHPRTCGEKTLARLFRGQCRGSPPRMRGKGLLQIFIPEPLGITPAYAEKSRLS